MRRFMILMSYGSYCLIVFNEANFISLSHYTTIHHHQHSSFMTHIWQSDRVSWLRSGDSLLDVMISSKRGSSVSFLILKSYQSRSLNSLLWSKVHLSHSLTKLFIIINTAVLWLTWQSDRVSSTKLWRSVEVQSLSFWCHHQGQAWRRGSSVSFLILDVTSKLALLNSL